MLKTPKVHSYKSAGMRGLDEIRTGCGKRAWLSRTVASEAETATGARIEITDKPVFATCEGCLKSSSRV